MEFCHKPVLLSESIASLDIDPGGIYVDATVGGAGHSLKIAERLTSGRLICLDRDPDAVQTAKERLAAFPNVTVINSNYSDMDAVLAELGIEGADGILMDLGVSSFQLDSEERGFSYHTDVPLDMRMDKQGISARDIVNGSTEKELADMLYRCADEKYSRRIAAAIVQTRQTGSIETTKQLCDIISSAVPAAYKRNHHPARKTFQAIRMTVNDELGHLERGLKKAFGALKKDGRLSVITFHSIEDRVVKQYFASLCVGCICPKELPVCVCGHVPEGRLLSKKPVAPSDDEVAGNSRSRSAKLRTIIKL